MLRLALAFLLALPAFAGYANYYTITIDHTKVVTGTQTNYVLTISGTYSQFKTAANGGDIQNTTTCCANTETVPADMIFTTTLPSGGVCTKNLDWDIPYYIATTGAIEVHVGPIASLSNSVDTVLYVCTKNAAVTTYQSTYTTTWPTSIFNSVYHFGDLTTLDLHDSTVNANTATNHGATLGTGLMGGGLATDGTSSKYIAVAGMLSGNVRRSIFVWFKTTTSSTTMALFDMGTATTNNRWLMYITPANLAALDTNGHANTVSCASCADGNWHMEGSNQSDLVSNCIILLDTVSSSVSFGTPNTTATPQLVSQSVGGANGLVGTIDEVEIFGVETAVSGYMGTRYKNISSPSTFYTISGSTPVGGNAIRHKSSVI